MRFRAFVIIVTLLPIITANVVYVYSAYNQLVPWCFPYLDGCTSISRSARMGDSIFLFRANMMVYAVLLFGYWHIMKLWLQQLHGRSTYTITTIYWLGLTGATCLILYVDFLGSSGDFYRFMRRYGIIFYFSLTPLAHLIVLNDLFKLKRLHNDERISESALHYLLTIISLILILGLINVAISATGIGSDKTENMIEWNYALLMSLLFAGTLGMWSKLKLELHQDY